MGAEITHATTMMTINNEDDTTTTAVTIVMTTTTATTMATVPRGVVVSLQPCERSNGHAQAVVAAVVGANRALASVTVVALEAVAAT